MHSVTAQQFGSEPLNSTLNFWGSSCARAQWISVWVLWILWALVWLGRRSFLAFRRPADPTPAEAAATAAGIPITNTHTDGYTHRFKLADHLARDLFLTLFFALTFNTVARGSGCGVNTLAWIYLALAAAWLLLQLAFHTVPRVLEVLVGWTVKALALAMLIVAFSSGWVSA
jgi:uncharacterized MAPEG superfamily protein